MHVFCIFVFAPVQHNWVCFTWKGALETRSLLLLLLHTAFRLQETTNEQISFVYNNSNNYLYTKKKASFLFWNLSKHKNFKQK